MKLSTKGRYGLRAMIDLAANFTGEYIPLYKIAERQGISERYLEQVFSALKKAGLVKSIKGAQGGYALSGETKDITVRDIISTLEGDISIIDNFEFSQNDTLKECIKIYVWDKMDVAVENVVNNITLEELVRKYDKVNRRDEIMYYI